eukprot:364681-Chlamydomonas_euryale.AAC.17
MLPTPQALKALDLSPRRLSHTLSTRAARSAASAASKAAPPTSKTTTGLPASTGLRSRAAAWRRRGGPRPTTAPSASATWQRCRRQRRRSRAPPQRRSLSGTRSSATSEQLLWPAVRSATPGEVAEQRQDPPQQH